MCAARKAVEEKVRMSEEPTHALWTGANRSAAIGISVLIVFYDGLDWHSLVLNRSKEVANHPDLLHVIPSCMFQPLVDPEKNIHSPVDGQEYLEELFNKEETERDPLATRVGMLLTKMTTGSFWTCSYRKEKPDWNSLESFSVS